MKWPLVKVFNLSDTKASPKWEIKILPVLPFKILKGLLCKECPMGRILVSLNRSVVGNVDDNPRARSANPVHLLKELDQILNVFKEMPAKNLVHRIIAKRKPPLGIANNVHSFTSNAVSADITGTFDSTGSEIDLYRVSTRRPGCYGGILRHATMI